MAWIAFASVPAMLVVMLAMGHLEARLLPRNPPGPPPDHAPDHAPDRVPNHVPDDAPAQAGAPVTARLSWEIPAATVESRTPAAHHPPS